MSHANNPQAALLAAKRKYLHNTPVWHTPVAGGERLKSWTRGEPVLVEWEDPVTREPAYSISVRLKDGTAPVNIEHIEWREYDAADVPADLPPVEPAPAQELMIYFYSASANHPRGIKQWDGTLTRPMITTHADYLEARAEIARDGSVPHHEAINVHQLGLLGEAQAGNVLPTFTPIANVELRTPQEVQDIWIDRVRAAGCIVVPAAAEGGEA